MRIRWELNPHPAGQEHNIPVHNGRKLRGSQHKYRETILFFPSQGQTCHAYCTFCFRWPQFVGMNDIKFAMRETNLLVNYIKHHPEITDLIFTGGDPMVMRTKLFAAYVDPILKANIRHLKTIRIGTKALSYWPYRFFADDDADELMYWFHKICRSGKHLSIMAHFNHPREMETKAVADGHGQNPGNRCGNQNPVSAFATHQRPAGSLERHVAKAGGDGMRSLLHVCCQGYWFASVFRGDPGKCLENIPVRLPESQRTGPNSSGAQHVRPSRQDSDHGGERG